MKTREELTFRLGPERAGLRGARAAADVRGVGSLRGF